VKFLGLILIQPFKKGHGHRPFGTQELIRII
jgi:hypothetical protein